MMTIKAPDRLQDRLIRRAWQSDEFATLLRTQPKAAIAQEIDVELPDELEVRVHEESVNVLHLVIPQKPLNESATVMEWQKSSTLEASAEGSACATLSCKCDNK